MAALPRRGLSRQQPAIECRGLGPEAAEGHLLHIGMFGETLAHGGNRDAGRALQRITEDAGRDGGKGDAADAVRGSEIEGVAIAGGEQAVLAEAAAMPYRADGMDDMARLQPETGGDPRLARRTRSNGGAGFGQLGS